MGLGVQDSWLFSWVLLPLLIFFARILDVSIGTLRIVFLSKGRRFLAPLLGFVEVFIWILVIGQIFKNLNNFLCYVMYAAGFAAGNYVGLALEERIALGLNVVRVILKSEPDSLVSKLVSYGFGVTIVDATGAKGPVKILFAIVRRKDVKQFLGILQEHAPKAFYSIEDVRNVHQGIFPARPSHNDRFRYWLRGLRKGK